MFPTDFIFNLKLQIFDPIFFTGINTYFIDSLRSRLPIYTSHRFSKRLNVGGWWRQCLPRDSYDSQETIFSADMCLYLFVCRFLHSCLHNPTLVCTALNLRCVSFIDLHYQHLFLLSHFMWIHLFLQWHSSLGFRQCKSLFSIPVQAYAFRCELISIVISITSFLSFNGSSFSPCSDFILSFEWINPVTRTLTLSSSSSFRLCGISRGPKSLGLSFFFSSSSTLNQQGVWGKTTTNSNSISSVSIPFTFSQSANGTIPIGTRVFDRLA